MSTQKTLNTSTTILFKIYSVCILLMFVNSMYPWYIWNNSISFITSIFAIIVSVTLFFLHRNYFVLTDRKIIFLLLLIILCLYIGRNLNIIGICVNLSTYGMIFGSLLMLKNEYQSIILKFITKYFSIILLVSLITFIFFLLGISVSPSYIEYLDGRYPSLNYYTFRIPINSIDYIRFCSIFMEPGHLTMGLVPLIFANRFNLRNKYVVILFIVELLTFSLAGYLVMFVGFILLNFSLKKFKNIIYCILFILCGIVLLNIFGMEDLLDTFIYNRLDRKNIVVDNRTTASFDIVYKSVIKSSDKWFGSPLIDIDNYGGISGIRKFIVTDGLVGCIITIVFYIFNYILLKRKEIAVMAIVQLLLLYQNAYPLWYCMIIMYILGSTSLKYKNNEVNSVFSHTQRL